MGPETPGASGQPGGELSELDPNDRALLEAIDKGNSWVRAVLCTLARRGVQFRREQPTRAEQLLESFSTWPVYKAGQFAFDLLEVEDFMLDGDEPPVVPIAFNAAGMHRIATSLRSLQRQFDARLTSEPGAEAPRVSAHDLVSDVGAQFVPQPDDEPLPPLEAGFYLYTDVVLGLSAVTGPLYAQLERQRNTRHDTGDETDAADQRAVSEEDHVERRAKGARSNTDSGSPVTDLDAGVDSE